MASPASGEAGGAVDDRAGRRSARSPRHGPDDEEAARMREVVLRGRRDARAGSPRPPAAARPSQEFVVPGEPTQSDDDRGQRLARRRVTTSGRPGNATAVATSTTGLMAGPTAKTRQQPPAASRHQPPGDGHRAALAARQLDAGHRGDGHGEGRSIGQETKRRSAGTMAAMSPLTATPSTKRHGLRRWPGRGPVATAGRSIEPAVGRTPPPPARRRPRDRAPIRGVARRAQAARRCRRYGPRP